MAIPSSRPDRENRKFLESTKRPGEPSVDVTISNPGEIGSALGFSWDSFTIDRTNALTDIYNYLLVATPTGTVTITYTDTTKCEISGGSIVIL